MTSHNKKRNQEKVAAKTKLASIDLLESEKSLRRANFHSGLKIATPENMLKAYSFKSIIYIL